MTNEIVIFNGIVCTFGTVAGLLFAASSLISIANMTVRWRGLLLVTALLLPVTFLVSGIGVWVAHLRGADQLAMVLIALPWIYTVLFVLAMIISFKYS
jgi:hypothetical protein